MIDYGYVVKINLFFGELIYYELCFVFVLFWFGGYVGCFCVRCGSGIVKFVDYYG